MKGLRSLGNAKARQSHGCQGQAGLRVLRGWRPLPVRKAQPSGEVAIAAHEQGRAVRIRNLFLARICASQPRLGLRYYN